VADPNSASTTVNIDGDKTVTASFVEIVFSPEPTFISLTPNNFASSVGEMINFTLTVGDGDGYDDITDVLFGINESDGTRRYEEILLQLYRGRLRIWNHTDGRWDKVYFGDTVVFEDNLCSVDVALCSLIGNGNLLILNLNITPKQAFIDSPFTGDKKIWLELRDNDRNILTNEEIGAWTITE